MKKIINKILFSIIEKIEKIQYKNITIDQDDPLKKIINIEFVDKEDLYVDSPEGWVKISELNETQPFKIWSIITEDNKKLFCADNHILFNSLGQEILVKDLNINDKILTKNGTEKIIEKTIYNQSNSMIDLSVESDEMIYYTNDILSHNTITAAITILHYCLFNTNKGVMVVANKADTVVEILDKIKNIYKQLPFFLKQGIINWNQKNIVFENGCRIKSQARSKEPAIGFTIDLLYMDEFAHIPPNIIRHYYKAAVPTVSSIKGSKIIITSTPNGANLFKELVVGALLPEGHPDKNMYKLIKVLWWQVPDGEFDNGVKGTRLDPKLYIQEYELKKYGIKLDDVYTLFDDMGITYQYDSETTDTGERYFIKVLYVKDEVDIEMMRQLKVKDVSLQKVFSITNWQENEIKLIGGEENFNQEYNIQFIAGSKRILSAKKAKELNERDKKYKYRDLELLDEKLRIPYDELRFDPDFIEQERDKYYWACSIDTSEGLGQDDSVINFFRLMVRDEEWLKNNNIRALHEAFYLKQTFVYNFNKLDPNKELTELFYLLGFEYLDPNRLKVVLELNSAGTDFLNGLKWVFNGDNEFGNYIFVRYKHNMNDKRKKVGLKVSRNKKQSVKTYIDAIEDDTIYVDDEITLSQMENFVKQETRAGNFTYKADAGNDDHVMTVCNLSTFLKTQDFKTQCQAYYNELPQHIRELIDDAMDLKVNPSVNSYSSMNKNISKARSKNNRGKGKYTSGSGKGRFFRK